jgi:ribonuclease R
MSRLSPIAISFVRGFLPSDLDEKEYKKFLDLQKLGVFESLEDGRLRLKNLYRIGKISILDDTKGYLSLEDKEQKDLLIEPHHLADAKNKDEVVVKRIIAKRGRASAKVIYVLNFAQVYNIGYLNEEKSEIIDIKTSLPIKMEAKNLDLKSLKSGTLFLIDSRSLELIEVLGHINDPKVDEKISLLLHNRADDTFEDLAIKQANEVPKEVLQEDLKGRVDLRKLDFCTIDPVSAKDFDDAIFWDEKNNILYVAIADVSYYVDFFSPIDKEAKERGFTTYFPHKAFPMLPRELSENICSLKPNVDRLAFVCKIWLDKNLEPKKEEFFEAVICSKRRFNYDEVDEVLEDNSKIKEEDKKIWEWLLPLSQITRKLKQKRLKKGFDFRSQEIKLTIDENHLLKDTVIETGTLSHSLIEECMLLANKAAAKRFKGDGDSIFRIHEAPTPEKLQNLIEELGSIGIFVDVEDEEDTKELIKAIQEEAKKAELESEVDELIIQSLTKAAYSHINKGHFGLGFEQYSHFTSPIRRYSDLILHRLIKADLKGDKKQAGYLLRNIEPISVLVSKLEREATKAEWDFRDRKFARWAKNKIGVRYLAQVIQNSEENNSEKEKKAKLISYEVDGVVVDLKDSGDVKLFEKVIVEITEVDLYKAKIWAKVITGGVSV